MKYKTTSTEDRERAIRCYIKSKPAKEIPEDLNIKLNTVYKIIKAYQSESRIAPKPKGGAINLKVNVGIESYIIRLLDEDCTLRLTDIKEMVKKEFDIELSISRINRCCSRFFYNLKRIGILSIRRNDEENLNSREEYSKIYTDYTATFDEEEFFFVDEVGFSVSLRPLYGRSKKGTSPVCVAHKIRSRNISTCFTANKNGFKFFKPRIVAYKSDSFCDYIKDLLNYLELKGITRGILVMDNAAFNKTETIKEFIETTNFKFLYLPPYSPFLNPIENLFSKVKNYVRYSKPENESDLFDKINEGFKSVTREDCNGYYKNMNKYLVSSGRREIIKQ
ncbi:hypothetical protein AYI70_g3398 [Smittium culicis]|uniref:Tc1-like transposase DDE domain-containing protein n=1 Tax=Smittium culicis TaxID=133412 RepID=A0A1R1Y457_9FUNG|nr:hypothetical protein AYI70_g3398 [Smittium culicis]